VLVEIVLIKSQPVTCLNEGRLSGIEGTSIVEARTYELPRR
jgi:hypothetical protein